MTALTPAFDIANNFPDQKYTDPFQQATDKAVQKMTESHAMSLSSRVHDLNVRLDSAMPDKVKVILAVILPIMALAAAYGGFKYGYLQTRNRQIAAIVTGVLVFFTSATLSFYAYKDFDADDSDESGGEHVADAK